MLMVVQKVFFGPVTKKDNRRLPDVTSRELVSLAPLAMAIFVVGLFPNVLLSEMRGAVERTVGDFDARVEASPGPKFYEGPIKLNPRSPEAPDIAPAQAIDLKESAGVVPLRRPLATAEENRGT
jgi:NADH-quinone oxidoreductase subunit M